MGCLCEPLFYYRKVFCSFVWFWFFLAVQCCVRHLNSPTRDGTRVPPTVEAWSLNHWTAREVPYRKVLFLYTNVLEPSHCPYLIAHEVCVQSSRVAFRGLHSWVHLPLPLSLSTSPSMNLYYSHTVLFLGF